MTGASSVVVTTEMFADLSPTGSGDSDPRDFVTVDLGEAGLTMLFAGGSFSADNGVELWALQAGKFSPVEFDPMPGQRGQVAVDETGSLADPVGQEAARE